MKAIASVSVVIPCYRCVETLERAVASVTEQTVMPLELILVDDGSGDGTRELMEQLQARFKPNWVRLLLRDVNAGAATARNAGWDLASGDYVAFLDADDAWHPRKIEIQFGYMESHPEIVISGHQHRQISAHDARDASIDRLVFRMVSKRYILFKNPFVTPSFMIRRNVGVRFLAGRRFMEDHLLLMQIVMVGGQVAKADFCLAYLFKPIYGHSGLSASMLQMQLAELDNYKLLHSKGAISIFEYGFFLLYSSLKFFRRMVLLGMRRLVGRQGHH